MNKMEINQVLVPKFPQNCLKQERGSLMDKNKLIQNRNLNRK